MSFSTHYCDEPNTLSFSSGYYLRIRQLQSGSMKVGSITSPEVNMHTVCFRFSYKFTRKGGYARFAVKYVKSKDVPRAMKYLSSAENWTEVNVSIQISQPYKVSVCQLTQLLLFLLTRSVLLIYVKLMLVTLIQEEKYYST